jgi:hypothetical protein
MANAAAREPTLEPHTMWRDPVRSREFSIANVFWCGRARLADDRRLVGALSRTMPHFAGMPQQVDCRRFRRALSRTAAGIGRRCGQSRDMQRLRGGQISNCRVLADLRANPIGSGRSISRNSGH